MDGSTLSRPFIHWISIEFSVMAAAYNWPSFVRGVCWFLLMLQQAAGTSLFVKCGFDGRMIRSALVRGESEPI